MAALSCGIGTKFGHVFIKDSFTFLKTTLSFAFVNIKPVVEGHVLIAPKRCTERFSELSENEVSDLFLTVQKVSKVIQKHYAAESLSIAIQDGPEAGQTVKLEMHDKEMSDDLTRNIHIPHLRSEEQMTTEATELQSYFTE